MKRFALIFAMAFSAQAQVIGIDIGKVVHAISAKHQQVPASVKWRRITAALAGAATIGDFVSTNRKISQGFCELNPGLKAADGCHVNEGKFIALKVGILVWLGAGEELMHKLPHGQIWDRENIILNTGAAVGFAALSIHNEAQ